MSKDLLSSRLVKSLRTHLETDLSILGRLHYKNQSQHHLALFWRRVVEVDRVGRRLLPAWESALQDGAKHQDVRKLSLLVSRLFLATTRLHSHALPILNLTHFLPLITTLIAITSRVWSLCGVFYGHLAALWARDFPSKRPLPTLDGWEDVPPLAALSLDKSDVGSSRDQIMLSSQHSSGRTTPSSLAVETGEVVSRSRPHPPASFQTASSTSTASPVPLELGERICRPIKPSPLSTPAVTSRAAPSPIASQPTSRALSLSPPPVVPRPSSKFTTSTVKALKKRPLSTDDEEDTRAPIPKLKKVSSERTPTHSASPSPFDNLLQPSKPSKPSKTKEESSAKEEGAVKKKVKKKRSTGNEIDDIFG